MENKVEITLQEQITVKVQEVLETTQNIGLDQDLTQIGLDSMKAIVLIVRLEETFNIEFDDEELLMEYYSSINKIADRVALKI